MGDRTVSDSVALADVVPPHNNVAESITIGAMMLNRDVAEQIADDLDAADFYRPAHGVIFSAIVRLLNSTGMTDAVDAGTVMLELARTGDLDRAGGVAYLATVVESVPTALNGPHYAREVAGHAVRRRIAEAGALAIQVSKSTSEIDDIRERAQAAMFNATTEARDRTPIETVGDLVPDVIQHLEDIAAGRIPPGLPTGFADYDRLTNGHRAGQLIIPAGRTAMGKSVVTQNWLVHAADQLAEPAILVSVEMSKDEMMLRLLSQLAGVPLTLMQSGGIRDRERDKLRQAQERIESMPLWLVDDCRTTMEIRSYLRRFEKRVTKPTIVGVDYLQRLKAPNRADRHIEVGQQADDLKDMAQDMDLIMIAPCQLNRGPETRQTKNGNIPKLADLRESGNIEQTADIVVLLFRPGYYDKNHARAGEADFIVAKHRNGPSDTITVAEQLHFSRFVDMAPASGTPTPREWE